MNRQLCDLISPWLVRQRWFSSRATPQVDFLNSWQYHRGEVQICANLVTCGAETYHLPLTLRSRPLPTERGLMGRFGDRWVYDGIYDPCYAHALLRHMHSHNAWTGRTRLPAAGADTRVLTTEMSNSAIVVGEALLLKIFRTVTSGSNPDIEVPRALATCDRIPHLAGWHICDNIALAVATEYVADAVDAWTLAIAAPSYGLPPFSAQGLGAATAQAHRHLLQAFGPGTGPQIDLHARITWAASIVPALVPYASKLHALACRWDSTSAAPPAQRIHGDFHLGQALYSATRGWLLIDFEGEPLRPLAERIRPDSPLRDLAGMARSFAYLAAHTAKAQPQYAPWAADWSQEATDTFISGYVAGGGPNPADFDSHWHQL